MIISVKKDGSILSLILDTDKVVRVNCADFTITSYTGRKVKHLPVACSNNSIPTMNVVYRALSQAIEKGEIEEFRKVELFLQYPERLPANAGKLPNECPKGYVKWVLEQDDVNFTQESLFRFKRMQTIPSKYHTLYNILTSCGVRLFSLSSVAEFDTFFKFIERYYSKQTSCFKDLARLTNRIIECKEKNIDWLQYFNPYHTLKSNLETLKAILDQEKDKKICERQSRILPISEIESNNFVVVVPLNIQQLADEGKQQNNCVGYYYNNEIINGYQLIYFIRKKDSPRTSYMTCRFDVVKKRTVEHRFFNNANCTLSKYPELDKLVKRIDQKIVEILQG